MQGGGSKQRKWETDSGVQGATTHQGAPRQHHRREHTVAAALGDAASAPLVTAVGAETPGAWTRACSSLRSLNRYALLSAQRAQIEAFMAREGPAEAAAGDLRRVGKCWQRTH